MSTKQMTEVETIKIGISADSRSELVESLNGILADLFVLYTKARNYHWNVVGDHFFTLHPEFEKLYSSLSEDIDAVAERARSLGGIALGTMAQFLERTTLKESKDLPDASAMVSDLASDYEAVIRKLRQLVDAADDAKDAGTSDFLTGLMESYEKTTWMLRAYLR
jgi:starvation-inducible DNA-binding protein